MLSSPQPAIQGSPFSLDLMEVISSPIPKNSCLLLSEYCIPHYIILLLSSSNHFTDHKRRSRLDNCEGQNSAITYLKYTQKINILPSGSQKARGKLLIHIVLGFDKDIITTRAK